MKVYLSTLGCKLNESEIEAWARQFASDGYKVVDDPKNADMVVLNTCTVTHVAARKSRQMARQLARANPNAKLALTGCYVSVAPDEAKALPNVALVVPNADKDRLVEKIADFRVEKLESPSQNPEFSESAFPTSNFQLPTSRTRAFVKIEDGCNMSCTYCIIPIARGKERSRSVGDVVGEVKSLVDAGYKEIILTGVQISSYRTGVIASEAKQSPTESDANAASSQKPLLATLAPNASAGVTNLRDLVAVILAETNVPRLRLTSIAPWGLDESLLELFSDPRLCRHLHLSLQSGSDTVLRRMRRPYTTAQFARAVNIAREKIPDVGITTDVIVGFPGESNVEFEQSLEFIEQMQFSRVHVFPYSARSGTIAAGLPLQVADAVKESRAKQMQAVADMSMQAFAQRFIGREMSVLWETVSSEQSLRAVDTLRESRFSPLATDHHPLWTGYTDNYIRVVAPNDEHLANEITFARLTSAADGGAIGEVIQKYPK